MSHQRKTIRDAAVDLLIDADTAAGENVFPNRETSLWESELPAVLVFVKDETAEPLDLAGTRSIRTLQLVIECKVKATPSVDDDLDTLCDEVEDALAANLNLSGTALTSIYKSTETFIDAGSETEKGVATLTYEIKYIK